VTEDDPLRRALTLRGRLQALGEASAAFAQIHNEIDTEGDAEALALAFAQANQAFVRWLAEAGSEVGSELVLIARETGVSLSDEE